MKPAQIIFIAGPTAGGKSAAALRLAEEWKGEVVNADAMQVYRDLHIVTARPSKEEQSIAPHHLFGVGDGAEAWSAGEWARRAAGIIADVNARGKRAIVVGGTGLYFRAIEEGLSPIPATPDDIREKARLRREVLGASDFRNEVVKRDPGMSHVPEGDAQRLQRAWEVYEASGKPLSYYQSLPRKPLVEGPFDKAVILPPRERLYAQCDARAAEMFSSGAIDEVRALVSRGLDPSLPVMKALGVPEIAAYLNDEVDRTTALQQLQQNTRRFAKRQVTWFRHQAPDWPLYQSGDDAITVLMESRKPK